MRTSIFIAIILFITHAGYAQTNQEIALTKTLEAIKLMDEGRVDESISLLEEAQKLNPADINISYEIAYANYLKQDYRASIEILKSLRKHQDVNPLIYQLLGNSYSMSGDRKSAIKTYDQGLKKYPDSGILNLERGTMEALVDNIDGAFKYYEQGIKVDPEFPSNYFRAAQFYCNSTESVWGLIYGELFMNLERGSVRTEAMSEMLYETYNRGVQFKGGDTILVRFSKNNVITLESLRTPETLKIPYGMAVYETTLMLALIGEKEINISSLDRIRTRFLELYYEKEYNVRYPNALFEYQKRIMDAGHLEGYNYWLLSCGDRDGFEGWYINNIEKWEEFVEWFLQNPIELGQDNKFYREQY